MVVVGWQKELVGGWKSNSGEKMVGGGLVCLVV